MSADQLSLVPGRAKRVRSAVPLAEINPVVSVIIDSPLPHLDRLFDYAVPASMSNDVVPGVRVRVRFSGKLTDAWVVTRQATSDHTGALMPLASLISAEPVLDAQLLSLVRDISLRNAGVVSDVLRSAIPNRHARAEATLIPESDDVEESDIAVWAQYSGGEALIKRTCSGESPRAIVTTGNDDPALLIAKFAQAIASSKRDVIVVAPDRTAVERVVRQLAALNVPSSTIATLLADDGPEKRYRNYVHALRGQARIVVGTRSAVFAPASRLASVVVWDDWSESLVDPQAPYWNARDVAVLRSQTQNCGLVVIGPSISTESAALIPWAVHVSKPREVIRKTLAHVRCALDDVYRDRDVSGPLARIPGIALQTIKRALADGPVAVLVARAGYQPRLLCDSCRLPAVCSLCAGPLMRTQRSSAPTCFHCGQQDANWSCAQCRGTNTRATAVGSERTSEELGRAFPGIPVRTSSGDHIVREVDQRPAIVVATPGALPVATHGYSAAILLDGNVMLARPDLRAAEDTFAKWCEVTSQVRSGGEVIVVADPDQSAVQALIRHDPLGFATRELEVRKDVALPPAVRLAVLTGTQSDIDDLLEIAHLPDGTIKRGPVPVGQGELRLLLSIERARGVELSTALKDATAIRSARHKGKPVNIKIDPHHI